MKTVKALRPSATPTKKFCRAKRVGVTGGCQLLDGHTGYHYAIGRSVSGPRVTTWKSERGHDLDSWGVCGEKNPGTPEWKCARPDEHDGAHRAVVATTTGSRESSDVFAWADGERRARPLSTRDVVAALLDFSGDASLADACDKCGRELGEHDGKRCPPAAKSKEVPLSKLPRVCANAVRHATGEIAKGPHAKVCEREIGHEGPHRIGPHGEFEHVVEWEDLTPGWVAYNRKAQRTLEKSTGRAATAEKLAADDLTDGRKHGPDRILGFKVHPVAAVYPLLEGDEFADLVDDMKANGQTDKIVLVDIGKETFVLDGRNRGRACEIGKLKPRFEAYSGPTDVASLMKFVVSKNDRRRHYSKGVRAMIAADMATLHQGERQTGKSAGVTQAQAAKLERVSERLVRLATVVKREGTAKLREAIMRDKIAVDAAADAAMKLPKAKQDELAEKALAKGGDSEVKRGHVRALVKQAEKRAVVAKINKQQVRPMPVGPFRLILVDPPWPYENSDQHEGSRGHMDYPGMPMEDICRLRVEIDRVAHEDCVLAMYVTNAFVREIGRVLDAWGFEHRTMFTWDKGQPGVGTWGRGRTEHLVIASRGKPVHTLNELETLIRAPRREPGRKPDLIAELLAKHCPGPHLEMFAREERPNWGVWGAETNKFAAEKAA